MTPRQLSILNVGVMLVISGLRPAAAVQGKDDGGVSSGGGLAVVCFKSPSIPKQIRRRGGYLSNQFLAKIESIEMLDLYDAKQPRGYDGQTQPAILPLSQSGSDALSLIDDAIVRLGRSFPEAAINLAEVANLLDPQNIVQQEFGLTPISDADWSGQINAERCVVATMGVQYFESEKIVLQIDSRLFRHPKHSLLSQNVFLLHEVVYAAGRKLGHRTSLMTRQLVALLITDHGAQVTVEGLRQALTSFGLIAKDDFVSAMPYHVWQLRKGYLGLLRLIRERAAQPEVLRVQMGLNVRCGVILGYFEMAKPGEIVSLPVCRTGLTKVAALPTPADELAATYHAGAARLLQEVVNFYEYGSGGHFNDAQLKFIFEVEEKLLSTAYGTESENRAVLRVWREMLDELMHILRFSYDEEVFPPLSRKLLDSTLERVAPLIPLDRPVPLTR